MHYRGLDFRWNGHRRPHRESDIWEKIWRKCCCSVASSCVLVIRNTSYQKFQPLLHRFSMSKYRKMLNRAEDLWMRPARGPGKCTWPLWDKRNTFTSPCILSSSMIVVFGSGFFKTWLYSRFIRWLWHWFSK